MFYFLSLWSIPVNFCGCFFVEKFNGCPLLTFKIDDALQDLEAKVKAYLEDWYDVPADKKGLREWERELIYKWQSPFNKEMWDVWGQPFGKEVLRDGK
jgi:hypothetical protein